MEAIYTSNFFFIILSRLASYGVNFPQNIVISFLVILPWALSVPPHKALLVFPCISLPLRLPPSGNNSLSRDTTGQPPWYTNHIFWKVHSHFSLFSISFHDKRWIRYFLLRYFLCNALYRDLSKGGQFKSDVRSSVSIRILCFESSFPNFYLYEWKYSHFAEVSGCLEIWENISLPMKTT